MRVPARTGWHRLHVQSLLAMMAVAPLRLLVVDPHLPEWLPDLRLEGVWVGDARVDLEFRRTRGGHTTYRVVRRTGAVVVLRQPPPQAPGAGPLGRAFGAMRSVPRCRLGNARRKGPTL